jgi:hypothetical protein
MNASGPVALGASGANLANLPTSNLVPKVVCNGVPTLPYLPFSFHVLLRLEGYLG